jgi:hypothetical protein
LAAPAAGGGREYSDWTHELKAPWGWVRLAAGKRFCSFQLHGLQGDYIFADLQGADIEVVGEQWQLALKVRDAKCPLWNFPMRDARQARQWKRVFGLAIEQRL